MMKNDHFPYQNAAPASSSLFLSPPKLRGVLVVLVATLCLYIIFSVSGSKPSDYVDGGHHTDRPTPISIEPHGLQQQQEQEQMPEQASLIVYLFCWNEEDILPYTLRHYAQFANKIVVLDNNSTDSSQDIVNQFASNLKKKKNQLQQKPQIKKKAIHERINRGLEVELRVIDTKGVYPEQWMTKWRNSNWKEARGKYDWAIVVDMDELVQFDPCNRSSSLKHFLWEHRHDADVIAPIGYDMYYEGFPFPEPTTAREDNRPLLLTEVAVQGYRTSLIEDQSYPTYSKPCILQVNKVEFLSVAVGGHSMAPGSIPKDIRVLHIEEQYTTDSVSAPLKLLHYGPGLGTLKYRLQRVATLKERLMKNEWMVKFNLGSQYMDEGKSVTKRREQLKAVIKEVPRVSIKLQCK